MSNVVHITESGLGETIEWKLIHALCQSFDRLLVCQKQLSQLGDWGARSRRRTKLWTAIFFLDCQIRVTLTVVKFELLLYAESESEDSVSLSSFESEEDDVHERDNTNWSRDYAVSQATGGFDEVAALNPQFGEHEPSPFPPVTGAWSHLRDLCCLLEARVNPHLCPRQWESGAGASDYPKLDRLIQHIQSSPFGTERLQIIPVPGSGPKSFLFNITEDVDVGEKFVALADPSHGRPSSKTLERLLREIDIMKQPFIKLNTFINSLDVSIGSVTDFAAPPTRRSTSNGSFASFALLSKFQQRTAAVCRAVSSDFESCSRFDSIQHKALLQLPSWEDFSGCISTEAVANPPVRLFLTRCPQRDWQPASVYTLLSQHRHAYKKQRLCKAVNAAYSFDSDLKFYLPQDLDTIPHGETHIHIPTEPVRTRQYDGSFPDDSASLWTLIDQGYFAKEATMDLRLRTRLLDSNVIDLGQRKTLAIKLILGTMLSIGSNHVINTWDPTRIHFLKPLDAELTPLVSLYGNHEVSGRPIVSASTILDFSTDLEEDDDDDHDDPKPLVVFALLAKALLHIAHGESLSSLEFTDTSESSLHDEWKRFRRVIERSIQSVTSGRESSRDTLPFLHAAYKCLDFHTRYQLRVKSAPSISKTKIAWQLVFDDIISQIDSTLALNLPLQYSIDVSVEDTVPIVAHRLSGEDSEISAGSSLLQYRTRAEPATAMQAESTYKCTTTATAQPEITLFDGADADALSPEAQRASVFFDLLSGFHESYSRSVTERKLQIDGKPPRRIRVAVLDTGIDFRHPGLKEAKRNGRIREEWCQSWIGARADDDDDDLHGTNCVYLLHKAAPEADIFVEKVFKRNSFKNYEAETIAKAIKHAVEKWGVDVISMSFGMTRPQPRPDANLGEELLALEAYENIVKAIENSIERASSTPCLMFAAASNNGKNEKRAFPARCPGVICVHASDGYGNDGGINPRTENGTNFMTLGMGHELITRDWVVERGRRVPTYKKMHKSGSSFATPVAAGVAATVLDLAARVSDIGERAREKLSRHYGMEKMFELMGHTPGGGHYCFLAPWNHWETHWQADKTLSRLVWDRINALYSI